MPILIFFLVYRFLKMLEMIVQEPDPSFKSLLPNVISFGLDHMLPTLNEVKVYFSFVYFIYYHTRVQFSFLHRCEGFIQRIQLHEESLIHLDPCLRNSSAYMFSQILIIKKPTHHQPAHVPMHIGIHRQAKIPYSRPHISPNSPYSAGHHRVLVQFSAVFYNNSWFLLCFRIQCQI